MTFWSILGQCNRILFYPYKRCFPPFFCLCRFLRQPSFPSSTSLLVPSPSSLVSHFSFVIHFTAYFFLLCRIASSSLTWRPINCDSNHKGVISGPYSGDHSLERSDPPLFPFVRYIEEYGNGVEDRPFSAEHLAGGLHENRDIHSGCLQDTSMSAWNKRSWLWEDPEPLIRYATFRRQIFPVSVDSWTSAAGGTKAK